MSKGPPIFAIPLEIRVDILELMVLKSRSHPQHASTLQRNGRISVDDCSYRSNLLKGKQVMHESPDPKVHEFPTLFANKQLRAETLSVIRRLPKDYWVDLLLVDESELWPTWISVPCLTTTVNKVRADVRMMGLSRQEKKWCQFTAGCGGPSILSVLFFDTLDRFLQLGPGLDAPQFFPLSKEIIIKTLDLNFVSPDNPEDMFPEVFSPWEFPRYENRPTKPDGTGYLMRPETLFLWLKEWINLSLDLIGGSDYGELLYERIGRIRFLVDGKLQSKIDLARRFAELMMQRNSWRTDPREMREIVWMGWARQTYRKRIELGLPVVEDESL